MSRYSIALFFVLPRLLLAQWSETSAQSEASSVAGLIHRHIEMADAQTGETVSLDCALFPMKTIGLRVLDNPDGSSDLAEAVPRQKCLAGVNGGYFDPGFAPLGLRLVDGKVVRPLLRARLMTGVLISAAGSVQILRVGEYSPKRKATAALQCGPLLVDGGAPVKGLDHTREARRTFAFVAGDHAALGLCSGTSLAGAAQVLAALRLDHSVKVSRALNLDGGSSSAFWFQRASGGAFSISEMKNVRDFVGIAPR